VVNTAFGISMIASVNSRMGKQFASLSRDPAFVRSVQTISPSMCFD
jgi:hypothetical protein